MKHPARWIALALAVVLAVLVVVLFTRPPAEQRLVKSPLVGHQAPRTAEVQDQRGRFVLVNFFATWCTPCKEEHDDLVRFAAAHPDDARVVSIVFSDDAADVDRFFAQRGGTWPVVHDEDGSAATAWGVARVPESYLVSPNGTVLGKITGGVRFESLQELLRKYES